MAWWAERTGRFPGPSASLEKLMGHLGDGERAGLAGLPSLPSSHGMPCLFMGPSFSGEITSARAGGSW